MVSKKRASSNQPKGQKSRRPRDGRRKLSLYLSAIGYRLGQWWPSVRKLLLRAAAFLASFVLFLTVMVAVAGWYTSRSEFCNSCHIMEPYYVSWQESSHADVACIKCHFAPGFAEKVRGKMLGLVQLAKYLTKSEGPRPAAEIPDASCLRSGCHETRLLSGKVEFRGVPFDHQPHLNQLRRGKQLRCTSCHSQMVQGQHMSVTPSTCYLCHFKDAAFNEGLGACTRCHAIPMEEFDLGGGIKFSHELAYEKGVDCYNCHMDVVQGNGEVPRERCRVCHNRQDDLARIDDHVFMHQMHVSDHKIDCTDCHLEIQHSLDEDRLLHAATDCQSCHPKHHNEQVEMFEGVGGESVAGVRGGMTAARIGCKSCHRAEEVSVTGTVLWKASEEVCAMCHSPAEVTRLRTYTDALKQLESVLNTTLTKAKEALPASELADEQKAKVAADIEQVQNDLDFLREGNFIHNIHYASTLIDKLLEKLKTLCEELKIPPPDAAAPVDWKEMP